ncbi:Y-family DNA polymerase [Henriciella aquimarina]|uniref:Y-family DNA polymerase n=1 Tax=Henriciella aquimarina TaxID=545261 RepID=UPI001301E590|nr:type VI secretion protein ImpB [Henriciella aquimarina]
MRKPDTLECLYIDFDCYFASVEKQLCPELRGRPVGVVPLDSPHTSLIARCYTAKRYGLQRGTSAMEAKRLCPDIALPVARHDVYVRMHHEILRVIDRFVPVAKVWSVDEMECRLCPSEQAGAVALAERIRAGLREEIGPWVTPSIGLGPNQFLAKVAAEMNKPNGLTVLSPEALPGPLLDLPLDDLPGIAKGMLARLHRNGIFTMEALWHLSPKHARAIWGSVEGERFWAQLRGYAVARPETSRRMFGHGRVLVSGWRSLDSAFEVARLLTVKASRRMRREGYLARRFTLSLKRREGHPLHWETSFFPARDDQTFLKALSRFYREAVETGHTRSDFARLSVFMHDLVSAKDHMSDLFTQPGVAETRDRREQLSDLIDAVNTRHQQSVIGFGLNRQPPGGYAGAKIAFGRVPDLSDF